MNEGLGSRERIGLRVPDELKRRLNASALRSGRTLNAEIISRLIESYGDELNMSVPEIDVRPKSLDARVAHLEDVVARLSAMIEAER